MPRQDQLPFRRSVPDSSPGSLRTPRTPEIQSGRYFTSVSRAGSPASSGRVQAVNQDSGLGRAIMSIADSVGNLGRTAYAIHEQTIAKKDERDQERMETLVKQLSATDKPLENMKELETFFNEAVREGILSPLENPSNWAKLQGHVGRMAGEELSHDILTDPDFNAQLNTLGLDGDASLLFREALTGRMAQVDESLHEDILASQAVREAEARAVAQGRSVQADEMDRALVREAKTALVAGDLEQAREILEGVRDASQRMPDVVKAAVVARVEDGDFSGAFELLEASKGLEVAGAVYGEAAYAEHRTQLDGYIHRQREREAGANSARVQIASGQLETTLQTLARQQGTHLMDVSQVNEWAENTVADIEAGKHAELAERIATESGLPREQVEFQMLAKVRGLANARSQEIEHAARFEDNAKARLRSMQVEAVEGVANSVAYSITQGDFVGAQEQIAVALDDPELSMEDRVRLVQLGEVLENPGAMALLESPSFSERRAQARDNFMAARGREWWDSFSQAEKKSMMDQAGLGDFTKEAGFPSVRHLQVMGVPGWDEQEARISSEFTELSYGFLTGLEDAPPTEGLARAKWLDERTDEHHIALNRRWEEKDAERQKKLEAEQASKSVEPTLSERIAELIPEDFDVQGSPDFQGLDRMSSEARASVMVRVLSTPSMRKTNREIARAVANRMPGDPGPPVTIEWEELPGAHTMRQASIMFEAQAVKQRSLSTYAAIVDAVGKSQAFNVLGTLVDRDSPNEYRAGFFGPTVGVSISSDIGAAYLDYRQKFYVPDVESLENNMDSFGVPFEPDPFSTLVIHPLHMIHLVDPPTRGEQVFRDPNVYEEVTRRARALGIARDQLIAAQIQFYQSQGFLTQEESPE